MLQPSHKLGLGLEAANEVGVVGVLGQNDFDGDLALDERLNGPIDRVITTCANTLTESVAANGPATEVFQADFFPERWGRG